MLLWCPSRYAEMSFIIRPIFVYRLSSRFSATMQGIFSVYIDKVKRLYMITVLYIFMLSLHHCVCVFSCSFFSALSTINFKTCRWYETTLCFSPLFTANKSQNQAIENSQNVFPSTESRKRMAVHV